MRSAPELLHEGLARPQDEARPLRHSRTGVHPNTTITIRHSLAKSPHPISETKAGKQAGIGFKLSAVQVLNDSMAGNIS